MSNNDRIPLFSRSRLHQTLDGTELVRRREACGLTAKAFAALCGWSPSYQCKLERPEFWEIHRNTAITIEMALKVSRQALIAGQTGNELKS